MFSKWWASVILDFGNSIFLTAGAVKGPIWHLLAKCRKDRSNRCGNIAIVVIFQDGGSRHLGFLKIRNFNCRSFVRGKYASSCHISSKSLKRLQIYGDFTVF